MTCWKSRIVYLESSEWPKSLPAYYELKLVNKIGSARRDGKEWKEL